MSKVYFKKAQLDVNEVNEAAAVLLDKLGVKFIKDIALKVHFGEKGNVTFMDGKYYDGIINYLQQKGCEPKYIETNGIYKGPRSKSDTHKKVAAEHGFTQVPIIIADGPMGGDATDVEVNLKHYKTCKIGLGYSKYDQMIVISHFKGHILAGFGGALKQLSMGCAARAGKLAMHSQSQPVLSSDKCTKCGACVKVCPVDAPQIEVDKPYVNDSCIGCGMCIEACQFGAMNINWGATSAPEFREKMTEYSYAAAKDKDIVYIQFALSIADMCDCMGQKADIVAKDIGVFASTDPVAIDAACMDMVDEAEGRKVFEGREALDYAEEIGLGSKEYEIVEVE